MKRWILLALLLSCARQPEPDGVTPPPDLRNAEVTIVITNQHWLDINVFLLRGSHRRRLGTAASLSSKVFSVPWSLIGGSTIRLGADPIGERTGMATEFLSVRPSSIVEWTISSGLRQSSVSVF